MAGCIMTVNGRNSLSTALIVIILVLAALGAAITIIYPNFVFTLQPGVIPPDKPYQPGGVIFEIIYVLLTLATNVLYLVGGGVVFFGIIIVTIRFLQSNPESPHKAHEVTRHVSGYLNLGLAFFIGAEIVRTVVIRTPTEFELLILTIVSRGLFSLILYLERRWHGSESD
jgi:uncharacterized membrane protein